LNLPRIGGIAPTIVEAVCQPDTVAATPPALPSVAQVDRDVVLLWAAERCVNDSRVWGGFGGLYRDFCGRCPEARISAALCLEALRSRGLKVWAEFVHGLTLKEDVVELLTFPPVIISLSFDAAPPWLD
jgi:hypothetical protein